MRLGRVIRAADLFCGGGGTSTGLVQACEHAGARVDLVAINHWERAVETHQANHPRSRHYCARIDSLDPRKVCPRGLDLLVASPECTFFSRASGKEVKNDQSRASGWDVLRWVEMLQPRDVLLENVVEWRDWGPLTKSGHVIARRKGETYRAFMAALRSIGYQVEERILVAADFGDPTTRRRLFVRAHRGRGAIAWPVPSHAEDPTGGLLARWRGAKEVIDFEQESRSIFGRDRPLAPTTLARIAEGIRRFWGPAAEPFLVMLRGTAASQVRSSARGVEAPLPTVSAGGIHAGLVQASPFLLSQQSGGAPRAVRSPMPTVAAAGAIALVQPSFVLDVNHGVNPKRSGRGNACRVRSLDRPLQTITATSRGIGLVEPAAFVVKTSHKGGNGAYVRRADQPLYAITTAAEELGVCQPFVVKYNRTGAPRRLVEPLPTLTAKDRLGLVEQLALDIHFRMLQPHELAGAMGFPTGYKFTGNKSDQVRQIGNAVAVGIARALCSAALELGAAS